MEYSLVTTDEEGNQVVVASGEYKPGGDAYDVGQTVLLRGADGVERSWTIVRRVSRRVRRHDLLRRTGRIAGTRSREELAGFLRLAEAIVTAHPLDTAMRPRRVAKTDAKAGTRAASGR